MRKSLAFGEFFHARNQAHVDLPSLRYRLRRHPIDKVVEDGLHRHSRLISKDWNTA
jgi:hypothetical protein